MVNSGDNNTINNSNSESLYGYTSSFFSYVYQSFYPITPTQTMGESDTKFHHTNTQPSDTFNTYNPFGSDKKSFGCEFEQKKPVLVKTMQMTNSPSAIERIGANIDTIREYTRSGMDTIGSFYNQMECKVSPYLTPVKRLGTIASQALNSEAADKVKENIQLSILNGIENTIKTTRLSYELYNLEKNNVVDMKRFNAMKQNGIMNRSRHDKLVENMEENKSVTNNTGNEEFMENFEDIKSEKNQEKRTLERRRYVESGDNRGNRTQY